MPSFHFFHFIFIISILSYNKCINTRKLSLAEQYEVEDLAYHLTKENGQLLKNLFDLSSVSGGLSCSLCSFSIDVLKNYLLH